MNDEQEVRQQSHYLEEQRWETRDQVRDWLLLVVMVAVTVGWYLLVYFNEPGLR